MRKKFITYVGATALLLIHTASQAVTDLPPTIKVDTGPVEEVCSEYRVATYQYIDLRRCGHDEQWRQVWRCWHTCR